MIRLKSLFVYALPMFLLTACGGDRQNDSLNTTEGGLQATLNYTVDNEVVPAFTSFQSQTANTLSTAEAFCSTTDEPHLTQLQQAWTNLSYQWNQTAFYNIGPLNDDLITPRINYIESMRQRGTDYTNTVRSEIETQVSGSAPLNEAYFDNLSFTKTGLLSLEVLIFEDSRSGHSQAPSDIVSDYQANNRKCDYLLGMAAFVNRMSTTLSEQWLQSYQSSGTPYATLLKTGKLDDDSEPIPSLLTTIQQHLDYIKRRKLQGTLDAQLSGVFYQNILQMLDGIEAFLNRRGETPSFFEYMEAGGYTSAIETVKTNLAAAKQAAVDQDRSTLATYIGLLDGNFKREIPDSLAVSLSINFNDGD